MLLRTLDLLAPNTDAASDMDTETQAAGIAIAQSSSSSSSVGKRKATGEQDDCSLQRQDCLETGVTTLPPEAMGLAASEHAKSTVNAEEEDKIPTQPVQTILVSAVVSEAGSTDATSAQQVGQVTPNAMNDDEVKLQRAHQRTVYKRRKVSAGPDETAQASPLPVAQPLVQLLDEHDMMTTRTGQHSLCTKQGGTDVQALAFMIKPECGPLEVLQHMRCVHAQRLQFYIDQLARICNINGIDQQQHIHDFLSTLTKLLQSSPMMHATAHGPN